MVGELLELVDIDKTQYGFILEKGIIDFMLFLKRVTEKFTSKNMKLILVSGDPEKVFNWLSSKAVATRVSDGVAALNNFLKKETFLKMKNKTLASTNCIGSGLVKRYKVEYFAIPLTILGINFIEKNP